MGLKGIKQRSEWESDGAGRKRRRGKMEGLKKKGRQERGETEREITIRREGGEWEAVLGGQVVIIIIIITIITIIIVLLLLYYY